MTAIPAAVRSWLYGVVTAVIPLLVVIGVIAGDQAALWLNLAAAVLGVGSSSLALANRPTKADDTADPPTT